MGAAETGVEEDTNEEPGARQQPPKFQPITDNYTNNSKRGEALPATVRQYEIMQFFQNIWDSRFYRFKLRNGEAVTVCFAHFLRMPWYRRPSISKTKRPRFQQTYHQTSFDKRSPLRQFLNKA